MSDNTTGKKYICPNCGARINKDDTKCPYCGYINVEGAEKEYMDRLYDIRDDLDVVDETAAAEYGKGYGRIFLLIGITMDVLLIITGLVFWGRAISVGKRQAAQTDKSNDMLEEMAWRKEAYREFDTLYEQGDYEALCEAVFSAYDDHHSVYDWDHFWFTSIYRNYLLTVEDLKRIDENGWHDYEAESIFYRCCFIYYNEVYKDMDGNDKPAADEVDRLKPVTDYMNTILHERMGFTDEDMAGFKDTILDQYDSVRYDACARIARERMGQFK